MKEIGVDVDRVELGFKSLRNFCLKKIDDIKKDKKDWIILAGRTGSNKTKLINILNNSMQSQFWNLMPKKTIKNSQIIDSHKIINAKIGSNFLKKQFEANSSSQHT